MHLSLSEAQSLYRLSLSCCSAEHSVCYCTCPSLNHSQSTVCLCPAAVQNTLSATAPVPLWSSQCTVCLCPAKVQNTVSATVPVPLWSSHCTVCLCPAAVQNTLSATAPVPLWRTVSVQSVSVLHGRHVTQVILCSSMAALWSTAHTHHHVWGNVTSGHA
jgi:hypothetical protein